MKRIALVAAAAALFWAPAAGPAHGQGADLAPLLSSRETPGSLQLKDLNQDWRRVRIATLNGSQSGMTDLMSQLMQMGMMSDSSGGKNKKSGGGSDAAAAMIGMSFMSNLFGGGGGGGGPKEPVYFTKGQTVSVGGETFLVAYRHQKPETNLMQMAMEAEKAGRDPDFAKLAAGQKLAPDSALAMTLINVRAITTVSDIRAFDMNREIAESAQSSGGLFEMIAAEAAKEIQSPAAKPAAAQRPAAARPAAGKAAPRRP